MILHLDLKDNGYDIVIERGSLLKADEYLNLKRKVLILTDEGVPVQYSDKIKELSKEGYIYTVKQGEGSKSIPVFSEVLSFMLSKGFSRKDCVVAVGGGVCGDLAGFVAASFMRGIDFYNIPTTVLSQVDSSIGGKTAVNLDGIKNIVGAFYQPKKVLVDLDVLKSLPKRQISNGLAEAVKMALTFDDDLFKLFEEEDPLLNMDKIITRSLELKKMVVEQDEKEAGLRKVLNFGHTIGHGIESFEELNGLYHGECVSLGMLPMCDPDVRERLIRVLNKLNLPTSIKLDKEKTYEALTHDKKSSAGSVTIVYVTSVGNYELKDVPLTDMMDKLSLFEEN